MNIAKPSSGFNVKILKNAVSDVKILVQKKCISDLHWLITLEALKANGHRLGEMVDGSCSAAGNRVLKVKDMFSENACDVYIYYYLLGDKLSVERLLLEKKH